MSNFQHGPTGGSALHAGYAIVLVTLLGLSGAPTTSRAQTPDASGQDVQVLTRGPVHEAFAGIVAFNPTPGITVTKAPPNIIEELPPEERPEGDNVAWIPGYWSWDDERNDFLWVSGTWRALPPGREWIAGYWAQTPRGYQWTSGYWADATARQTTYLPAPPPTVEAGPNIAAPSPDYVWMPGCWVWYEGRYAWRPGYWARCRPDWDWIPAYYVYTPRGYLFVGGFWDYPVARRGVCFAPVYFEPRLYTRRHYVYSPSIVISLGVFNDHLFVRPSYCHYYFGDYYAPRYHQGGFYASFTFQSSHHGYDPFYSRQRWEHRGDRDWDRRVESTYRHRRDNEAARPPRTYAAQRNLSPTVATSDSRMQVAAPIQQVARRNDSSLRFQPVAQEERRQLAQRGREVQQSREQRQILEARPAVAPAQGAVEVAQPTRVELPRSPIVSKPVTQLGRNNTPPPAQQSPTPEIRRQPMAKPSTSQPQPQPRRPAPERTSPPEQTRTITPEPQPSVAPQQRVTGTERQAQHAVPQPPKAAGVTRPEESPRLNRGQEQKAQRELQARQQDAAAQARAAELNAAVESARAQQEAERRANAAAGAARAQRNARSMEKQAQHFTPPTTGAPNPPQRRETPPGTTRPAPAERGATELLNNNDQRKAKGRPAPPDYPPAAPPAPR